MKLLMEKDEKRELLDSSRMNINQLTDIHCVKYQ